MWGVYGRGGRSGAFRGVDLSRGAVEVKGGLGYGLFAVLCVELRLIVAFRMKHTRGCSSVFWCSTMGALVTEAFSFAAAGLRDLVALWYSLVPLEASDLESSTIAVVRWRGGAIASRSSRLEGYWNGGVFQCLGFELRGFWEGQII